MKAAAGTSWPSRPLMLRPGRIAAAVLIAGVVGLGVGLGVHQLTAGGASKPVIVTQRHGMDGMATWAAGAKPAPPITTLTDQNGHGFALSSLHGRTVALVFFDSHCLQQCPLEGRLLAAAEQPLALAPSGPYSSPSASTAPIRRPVSVMRSRTGGSRRSLPGIG